MSQPISIAKSPNKKVVEAYMVGLSNLDRPALLSCLADDVERVEWADGIDGSGVAQIGKAAVIQNIDRPADVAMRSEITRMTEENNVVVAESMVRLSKKESGVFLTLRVCSIYELENGKIRKVNSFMAEEKKRSA
jgi:ketosteroid isomerase-like protein